METTSLDQAAEFVAFFADGWRIGAAQPERFFAHFGGRLTAATVMIQPPGVAKSRMIPKTIWSSNGHQEDASMAEGANAVLVRPLADDGATLERVGGKGATVAREYYIPAVLGMAVATERLRSGQRIVVDGDAGTVAPES